ncbi:pentatricopeptide repeat-containing protein At3g26540 [Macadamia integrifolia]|uniref:pentatricopeptide repeat-containing protein At3g26540 n=1 Tax=Macadamia integrifolia TaxID=60698 RepID=UPI001C4FBD8C|nr:pentatricopeptide repeat-containing protein At3g26540 [Macadamia integrifolia]
MGVNAASVLNRLLQKNTQRTKTPPTNSIAITNSIKAHLKSGSLKKAVSVLFASPVPVPFYIYARLFKICSSTPAIVEARKVESHLVTFHPQPPIFLLNRAIEAYGKCGCLEDARELFEEMPQRDGGSWNAIITAFSQGDFAEKAVGMFSRMNKLGVVANEITFASVLGSCSVILSLFLSRQVHGLIVKYGLCWNVILGSSLVDVYGKCRIIGDARRMFDEIPNPNSVSWNVIVRRYLEMGDEREAIAMFFKMVEANVRQLNFTFSNALIACSSISALNEGYQIHDVVIKVGFEEDTVVTNSLINMYAKCGGLEDARRLFDQPGLKNMISWTSIMSGYATSGRTAEARELFNKMPERSVVSWNAMLAGYVKFLLWEEALDFVFWMRKTTKDIDHVTLSLILNVCAGSSDVELGKQVHGFVYRHGWFSDQFVSNGLLDMYGKCRSFRYSRAWFFEMGRLRDRVSWNALISSYARHHQSEEAMEIFREMLWETTPSEFTFGTLLAACANIFTLKQGKQIHGYMIRNGYEIDLVIRGALVDMYSKCRCLEYALKVFKEAVSRDVILWNSMLLGCAHNGRGADVLELFGLMQKEGIKADHVTFQGILLACIGEGFVDHGRQYFNSMSDMFCIIPRLEHYECMIELFSRYGVIDELEDFIKRMPFDPTVEMLTRIFDACREHEHSRLGEWAAQHLNEFKPLTPFRFETLSEPDLGKL